MENSCALQSPYIRQKKRRSSKKQKKQLNSNAIENYVLGRTIGQGTFGKVKIGLHLLTGEKVAVKILEKSKIVEPADIKRVVREIKILKLNRHPNVIQLYEVIDSVSAIYLVMEYVDGGELFDFIVASERIPEDLAVRFFHQIVDALEYIHNAEITHRDLKPENMLLKKKKDGWDLKIVDFGLSNLHIGGKLLSTACGSPCYAAPEMIEGKKYVGPMADIWSLGVVLFAMVCGYLPFENNNTNILYKRILSCDYSTPNFISESVKDLIKRILETDPNQRYTISKIRSHPWFCRVQRELPTQNCSPHFMELNTKVLAKVEEFGLMSSEVIKCLSNGDHNLFTATYYLLLSKFNSAPDYHEKKYETLRIEINNESYVNTDSGNKSTTVKCPRGSITAATSQKTESRGSNSTIKNTVNEIKMSRLDSMKDNNARIKLNTESILAKESFHSKLNPQHQGGENMMPTEGSKVKSSTSRKPHHVKSRGIVQTPSPISSDENLISLGVNLSNAKPIIINSHNSQEKTVSSMKENVQRDPMLVENLFDSTEAIKSSSPYPTRAVDLPALHVDDELGYDVQDSGTVESRGTIVEKSSLDQSAVDSMCQMKPRRILDSLKSTSEKLKMQVNKVCQKRPKTADEGKLVIGGGSHFQSHRRHNLTKRKSERGERLFQPTPPPQTTISSIVVHPTPPLCKQQLHKSPYPVRRIKSIDAQVEK